MADLLFFPRFLICDIVDLVLSKLAVSLVETLGYFAALVAALMVLISLPVLGVMLVRGRKIPECHSCGARKVRPSREAGFQDVFASAFQIRPVRCSGCRKRFYTFLFFGEAKDPTPSVQSGRIVKVAIRFRYGLPNRIAIRVGGLPNERVEKSGAISDQPTALQA
jgi:hypothetical protein